jgi:trehalose 6-phosphate synthase
LPGALIVNPFDLSQMSEALERALSMPLAERQARHADMMAPLRENNLSVWRDSFLSDLRSVATAASMTQKTVKQVAEAKPEARSEVKPDAKSGAKPRPAKVSG